MNKVLSREIKDVEPVFDFLKLIGTQTVYGKFEIDLIDVGPLLSDRAVVSQSQLDLFAAQLYHASPQLYAAFMEAFPTANAGVYVGF